MRSRWGEGGRKRPDAMNEVQINYEESTPSPYARFWRRVAASVIDALIVLPVSVLALWFTLSVDHKTYGQSLIPPSYFILIGAFLLAYRTGFETSRYQGTPGKKIMDIIVTDLGGGPISFQAASIRSWVYWGGSVLALLDIVFGASTAMGGMGFFLFLGSIAITVSCVMVAFTDRQQGGHDIMADCLVVRKGARFEPPPPGSTPPEPAKPEPIRGTGALPARPPGQERRFSQI